MAVVAVEGEQRLTLVRMEEGQEEGERRAQNAHRVEAALVEKRAVRVAPECLDGTPTDDVDEGLAEAGVGEREERE